MHNLKSSLVATAMSAVTLAGCGKVDIAQSHGIREDVCAAVEGISARDGSCIFHQDNQSNNMVLARDEHAGCVILSLPHRELLFKKENTNCNEFLGNLAGLRKVFFDTTDGE